MNKSPFHRFYTHLKTICLNIKNIIGILHTRNEKSIEMLTCCGAFSLQKLSFYVGVLNLVGCGIIIIPLILCPGFIQSSQLEDDEVFQETIVKSLFIGTIVYALITAVCTVTLIFEVCCSKITSIKPYAEIALMIVIAMVPSSAILVTLVYVYPIGKGIKIVRYLLGVLVSILIDLYFLALVFFVGQELEDKKNKEKDEKSLGKQLILVNKEEDDKLTKQLEIVVFEEKNNKQ